MKPDPEIDELLDPLIQKLSSTGQYFAAFCAGFGGSLLPTLVTGHWPTQSIYIAALGYGLAATGLFHAIPPRAQNKP